MGYLTVNQPRMLWIVTEADAQLTKQQRLLLVVLGAQQSLLVLLAQVVKVLLRCFDPLLQRRHLRLLLCRQLHHR